MFFEHRDPVHKAMQRLVRRLRRARIPYAIMGAMAVNAHRAERTTKDVDVLLTLRGLERFCKEFVNKFYESVSGHPRRFIERRSGVRVDVLVTGLFPGRGEPKAFAFPDPIEASEEIKKIRVLTLPQLIQLNLAAGRHYDFGDVVNLIGVHNLDEAFLVRLHSSVHKDFIECLEEKRRDDQYEARQNQAIAELKKKSRYS